MDENLKPELSEQICSLFAPYLIKNVLYSRKFFHLIYMIDEDLLEEMLEKIEMRSLGDDDVMDYMDLFCQIANENDEVQAEIDEEEFRNIKFVFEIDGIDDFTLVIDDGQFSIQEGAADDWGAQLIMSVDDFTKLIAGEVDGNNLYMAGRLEAHGGLPRVVKFQTVMEIILEYIEDYGY